MLRYCFLLYFNRVAQSRECKMPAANIAKVFAPTLVGYSSPHPEPVQMLSEAKVQPKVCRQLLRQVFFPYRCIKLGLGGGW